MLRREPAARLWRDAEDDAARYGRCANMFRTLLLNGGTSSGFHDDVDDDDEDDDSGNGDGAAFVAFVAVAVAAATTTTMIAMTANGA